MARALHFFLLLVLVLAFLVPLLWMVSISVFPEGRGLLGDPWEGWADPRFENYRKALSERYIGDLGRLLFNTTLVTVLSVLGQCLCCSLAGYAFARLRFRGRDFLFVLVLATMMLPPQVLTIPHFLLFRALGMTDTFHPLILPAVLGGAPFFIFLFRQAFLALPQELMEAARLDGCGFFRVYWSVMLPLVKPMLGTVALFTFLGTWNDFWTPLIYLTSTDKWTLALGLAAFNRSYNVAVECMMAASGAILAPCLIVYFVAQRLFLRGLSVAASKR